jgi:hypothetical protein
MNLSSKNKGKEAAIFDGDFDVADILESKIKFK